MAQAEQVVRKRSHMSEGKISFETSKFASKGPSDPHWIIQISVIIVFSIGTEYGFEMGSQTLILGLLLAAIFAFRSRKHDNIPMAPNYVPFLGTFQINYCQNRNRVL